MGRHETGATASPNYTPTTPGEAAYLIDIIHDARLINSLRESQSAQPVGYAETGEVFLNTGVAELVHATYSSSQLDKLEERLSTHGTFAIPIAPGAVIHEGTTHIVPFVAATETEANHGDMSSMLYLRDHIQVSRAYMELYLHDPDRYQEEGEIGRRLLRSALMLMSTPSQLERFENVIRLGTAAEQKDWPQISLRFHDLEGKLPNGWRNKQDTLQMLGHLTFDAIDRGFIGIEELDEQDEQFMDYLVPFLIAVGFPRYENSGSWEEVTAIRTSVMAVETALLHKLREHLHTDDPERPHFEHVRRAYAKYRPDGAPEQLEEGLEELLQNGLTELGRRLPFESGPQDYQRENIKYREADAALVYLLLYDLPELLANNRIPVGQNGDILNATEIEDMILGQLERLMDPATGGMKRYENDSYQRTNFHTKEMQRQISWIKRAIQQRSEITGEAPDLDEKQRLRNQTVAEGREAAWTHPLSQLAAWAAKRSLSAIQPQEAERYRALSTRYLNQALRLITGTAQYTAALQDDHSYRVQRLPAYKLPECYNTYRDAEGEIIVASPHTPLNWSTAMLQEAVGLLRNSAEQLQVRTFGAACLQERQTAAEAQ